MVARRFLNTDTAPVLYSAHAKVVGARTGHVEGDDLVIDLTMVCFLCTERDVVAARDHMTSLQPRSAGHQ